MSYSGADDPLWTREVDDVALVDVQSEGVRWLWEGRIPLGKLTLLDGDPGLGKSLVTLDLGAPVVLSSLGRAVHPLEGCPPPS